MRYKRAVEKLRILTETCERVKTFWFDTEPFLKALYAFGEVMDGADPLDAVQVAVAINLSPEEVPWESSADGTDWLALADTMVWTGEFDEAERWLQRAAQALQADTGPDIRLLVHQTTEMLEAARGRNHEALKEFSAAEYLHSQLESSHAKASQVTGWMLATRARLGMTGDASAALAGR